MGSSYSVTRICLVRDCTARTHASKPYCHEHVDQNPHAQWVLAQLAEAAAEERAAQAG